MFTNVVVGLKEGVAHEPLLAPDEEDGALPRPDPLVTLVRGGTNEDEPQRLRRAEQDLEKQAERLREDGYEVSTEVGLIVVAAAVDLVPSAEQQDADLIVIGLAKRTRVGRR